MTKSAQILIVAIIFGNLFFHTNCALFSAKSEAPSAKSNSNSNSQNSKNHRKPQRIAVLQDEAIGESSGLVASQKNQGAFWTHNDSGGDSLLYAFDRAGKKLGVWRVANAKNVDWEDLASYTDSKNGESYLFIGDIGNNELTRGEVVIYRVVEPKIAVEDKTSSRKNPRLTARAEQLRLEYPDARRDAETLLVNPQSGDLYIASKNLTGNADIYKLAAPIKFGAKQKLAHIGQIGVPSLTPGFLTGGAISTDGTRLVLTDYFAAYEYVLPAKAQNFDRIWQVEASKIELGERAQGEAICYSADGTAIYATSEKRPTPLIEVKIR